MEIKVGDKVRVSKDAPRLYARGLRGCGFSVYDIDGEVAELTYSNINVVVPLKYIIKVEDEAKERKFKRGDKVVGKPPFFEKVWTVLGYDDKAPYWVMVGDGEYIYERNLEPYTEPSLEKDPSDMTEETAKNLSNVLEGYCNAMQSIADNFDWQQYTADLAKEIAIVYAKQKRDVRLAVRAAKTVVEELKKK